MPPRRLRQQQRSGYAQLPVFKYQTFDRNDLTFTDIPIVPPTQRPIRHYSQVADQLRQEGHPPPTSAPKSADIPHAETDGCLEATVSPLDAAPDIVKDATTLDATADETAVEENCAVGVKDALSAEDLSLSESHVDATLEQMGPDAVALGPEPVLANVSTIEDHDIVAEDTLPPADEQIMSGALKATTTQAIFDPESSLKMQQSQNLDVSDATTVVEIVEKMQEADVPPQEINDILQKALTNASACDDPFPRNPSGKSPTKLWWFASTDGDRKDAKVEEQASEAAVAEVSSEPTSGNGDSTKPDEDGESAEEVESVAMAVLETSAILPVQVPPADGYPNDSTRETTCDTDRSSQEPVVDSIMDDKSADPPEGEYFDAPDEISVGGSPLEATMDEITTTDVSEKDFVDQDKAAISEQSAETPTAFSTPPVHMTDSPAPESQISAVDATQLPTEAEDEETKVDAETIENTDEASSAEQPQVAEAVRAELLIDAPVANDTAPVQHIEEEVKPEADTVEQTAVEASEKEAATVQGPLMEEPVTVNPVKEEEPSKDEPIAEAPAAKDPHAERAAPVESPEDKPPTEDSSAQAPAIEEAATEAATTEALAQEPPVEEVQAEQTAYDAPAVHESAVMETVAEIQEPEQAAPEVTPEATAVVADTDRSSLQADKAVLVASSNSRRRRRHSSSSKDKYWERERQASTLNGHKTRLERQKKDAGLFVNNFGVAVKRAKEERKKRTQTDEDRDRERRRRDRQRRRDVEDRAIRHTEEEAVKERDRAARKRAEEVERERQAAPREKTPSSPGMMSRKPRRPSRAESSGNDSISGRPKLLQMLTSGESDTRPLLRLRLDDATQKVSVVPRSAPSSPPLSRKSEDKPGEREKPHNQHSSRRPETQGSGRSDKRRQHHSHDRSDRVSSSKAGGSKSKSTTGDDRVAPSFRLFSGLKRALLAH